MKDQAQGALVTRKVLSWNSQAENNWGLGRGIPQYVVLFACLLVFPFPWVSTIVDVTDRRLCWMGLCFSVAWACLCLDTLFLKPACKTLSEEISSVTVRVIIGLSVIVQIISYFLQSKTPQKSKFLGKRSYA